MRVFVTGASGFIGSAVVPELLGAGHDVIGLARSDQAAAAVAAQGAEVVRGSLADLDVLRSTAAGADAVVHLAFIHDFSDYAASAEADRRALEAFGEELAGSGRPLAFASGLLALAQGRPATEQDAFSTAGGARAANGIAGLALAEKDVRVSAVRLAPTVHGAGDHGFVPQIIQMARDHGVSAYIGDGANRWPAVHRLDAAVLFRLAIERAAAGAVLHGVAEEGITAREIAETIGAALGLPVESVSGDAAAAHFSWMAAFFGADMPATNDTTRRTLDWHPSQPGLLDDMRAHYFG